VRGHRDSLVPEDWQRVARKDWERMNLHLSCVNVSLDIISLKDIHLLLHQSLLAMISRGILRRQKGLSRFYLVKINEEDPLMA